MKSFLEITGLTLVQWTDENGAKANVTKAAMHRYDVLEDGSKSTDHDDTFNAYFLGTLNATRVQTLEQEQVIDGIEVIIGEGVGEAQ